MQENATPSEPCSDCKGLNDGTRSRQDPHQYLVLTGRSDSKPPVLFYRCLVCNSTLTCEQDGKLPRWKLKLQNMK